MGRIEPFLTKSYSLSLKRQTASTLVFNALQFTYYLAYIYSAPNRSGYVLLGVRFKTVHLLLNQLSLLFLCFSDWKYFGSVN